MATGIPVSVGELVDTPTINSWARGFLRKTTSKTVVSTVSATDLLNSEFSVPAGAMGVDRILRLTAYGDTKNQTGSTQATPMWELDFGSASVQGAALLSTWASSSGRHTWRAVATIANLGATGAQWINLVVESIVLQPSAASTNTGGGNHQGTSWSMNPNTGLGTGLGPLNTNVSYQSAIDTTGSVALALKVTLPTSNSNCDVTLLGALCEII